MTYSFRVGIRPLDSKLKQKVCDFGLRAFKQGEKATHAAFLLDRDIFDFDGDGWHRRRNVGRDPSFNWDCLGEKVNGTTHVSPDQLAQAIEKSGRWTPGGWPWFRKTSWWPWHNCHLFVVDCLNLVGAGFFYKDYRRWVMTIFEPKREWLDLLPRELSTEEKLEGMMAAVRAARGFHDDARYAQFVERVLDVKEPGPRPGWMLEGFQ